MSKKFGKLEKVDLRELWTGEATDFTPWLSKEENIVMLGEAIGLELEVQEQEQRVGLFRADILCKDVVNDHFVLIENQLERTDHTHLGQLMTYASGLDAVTIIWIAKTFAEEHRAALDWLNNITDESINFFGIELEAYRIGESLPAPNFNIVAKPNDWTKNIKASTSTGKITDARQLQYEYWVGLKKFIEDSKSFLKCSKPYPQHWLTFSLGSSNFNIAAICGVRDNFIRVDVNINEKGGKTRYNRIRDLYQEDLMKVFGPELVWNELPNAKYSMINIRKDADVSNRTLWNEQHEWLKDTLEKFDGYFRPKIKSLSS